MTQADLQKTLRQADPAAVLVSARILERIIREAYQLPNFSWTVPHHKSFVCDRQLLFRHAEQADLELDSDQLLPDTVLLLIRPDQEELSYLERKRLLLKYWRRLFHARVHFALESLRRDGLLDDVAIRERIDRIGLTEFEEIRNVLIQDNWLTNTASNAETFIEFAAVYLELRHFAPNLLANYFPGLRDFGRVEALLSQDIDSTELFKQTRLQGAADPVQPVDSRSDETQELYWKLVRQAQNAALSGNLVGAAILRMRASRVAPAAQTLPTRQEAEKDIAQLAQRLAAALQLTEAETSDWTRHLTLLLDKADQGNRPMEARVLEDLLRVCEDHEKEIYTLDLVEYILSGGKRPIKRPLPSQRLVRITKHLRATVPKLGPVRLSDTDRNHLTRLIQQALHKTEESLRSRFRPVLETALVDVGLKPQGPLQQAAFDKMVAELLDRISDYGFLTFAELRDTISRNQLKLPDLRDPEDFVRGDPLIRLDRRLASLLDGVYRPGEFYVRWLERLTALNFGTSFGRAITKFVTGPLLFAWLVLFILGFFVELIYKYAWDEPLIKTTALVMMGPAHLPQEKTLSGEDAVLEIDPNEVPEPEWWYHFAVLGPCALLTLAIMHSRPFRRRCLRLLGGLGRILRWIVWDFPLRLIPLSALRWLIDSWGFQLLWWYLVKPAAVTLLILFYWHSHLKHPAVQILLFFVVNLTLNSRIGRSTAESIRDAFVNLGILIRAGLLPGLFRFIIYLFKQVIEFVEYLLFRVDEWLRVRSGDSQFSMVVRTIAGAIWFPVSFFLRFYMVVLIEPGLNPIKFAISSVAAKIVYPLIITMGVTTTLIAALTPFTGAKLAWLLVVPTMWLLPDAFGFLAWELKENWSLFRANRGKSPSVASVGSHGESIRGLLQPGFHSGTVPRLYARLRRAERYAMQSRNWNAARAIREEIEEVAHAVKEFVERDMLFILKQSRAWKNQLVSVSHAYLSTNRIRVELEHLDHPALPVEIEIAHHETWMVASVASTGWLHALTAEQVRVFESCLAYLYKRSDVDLVREQIRATLPVALELKQHAAEESGVHLTAPPSTRLESIQVTMDELLVRVVGATEPTRFQLTRDLVTLSRDTTADPLMFARTPLTWKEWDAAWQKDYLGEGHPGLAGITGTLVRLDQNSLEAPFELSDPLSSTDRELASDRS